MASGQGPVVDRMVTAGMPIRIHDIRQVGGASYWIGASEVLQSVNLRSVSRTGSIRMNHP
jgi:hypothetical protein